MAVEMRSYQMKTIISIISHFENFKIIPDLQNCSPDQKIGSSSNIDPKISTCVMSSV